MILNTMKAADITVGSGAGIVLDDMSKAYGPTQAVVRMHLEVRPNQLLGVIGPNGAGKSTLMRIIAGETIPDSGRLSICGYEVDLPHFSPQVAHRLGIRFVHQELALCSNLTVFENFFVELGTGIERPWRTTAKTLARDALDRAFPGNGISPDDAVESLALAQRQMVEIARAASAPGLRLLILDEPTSALPPERVAQLRALLQRLRQVGLMVILITHRLSEVLDFVDRIMVMRGGAAAWVGSPIGLSRDDLIVHMGGRAPAEMTSRGVRQSSPRGGEPVLEVHDLSEGILRHVNLHVDAGEIVAVSGLEGGGQRDLLRAVYSARRSGAIRTRGSVAFASGDRRREGILPLWSVAHNISLSALRQMTHWGLLDRRKEHSFVAQWVDRLHLRAVGPDAPITSLSGGNQQKAIIARALGTAASLMLLDDPTRGVDAQTKQELYELLRQAATRGCGILWHSTEDKEILECDRVYVMTRGEIVDELQRSGISTQNLVAVAFDGQDTGGERTVSGKAIRPRHHRAAEWLSKPWMPPLVALGVMVAALGALNGRIFTAMGVDLTVGAAVPLVLAAIAQMFVILVGDIDLGLGSFLGLVNVLAVTWLVQNGLLGALAYSGLVLLYAIVGALIQIRGIPAIVVTLGMSFVWLGLGLTIQPTPGGQSPNWLQSIYSLDIPVIEEPVLITFVSAGLVYWLIACTRFGVVLRGFGNNPAAIEAAGWSTLRIRMLAYSLSGTFGLLAGLTVTAVTTSGDASAFNSYTLLSIAAVILGGSKFSGGIVAPVGVVAGALTLSFVNSLLSFLSISPNYTSAVEGTILLLLLIGRGLGRGRRDR